MPINDRVHWFVLAGNGSLPGWGMAWLPKTAHLGTADTDGMRKAMRIVPLAPAAERQGLRQQRR
jgi:hypothetical protein